MLDDGPGHRLGQRAVISDQHGGESAPDRIDSMLLVSGDVVVMSVIVRGNHRSAATRATDSPRRSGSTCSTTGSKAAAIRAAEPGPQTPPPPKPRSMTWRKLSKASFRSSRAAEGFDAAMAAAILPWAWPRSTSILIVCASLRARGRSTGAIRRTPGPCRSASCSRSSGRAVFRPPPGSPRRCPGRSGRAGR